MFRRERIGRDGVGGTPLDRCARMATLPLMDAPRCTSRECHSPWIRNPSIYFCIRDISDSIAWVTGYERTFIRYRGIQQSVTKLSDTMVAIRLRGTPAAAWHETCSMVFAGAERARSRRGMGGCPINGTILPILEDAMVCGRHGHRDTAHVRRRHETPRFPRSRKADG